LGIQKAREGHGQDHFEPLRLLAYNYDLMSQPNEVLALLNDAPWWGVKDLGEITHQGDPKEELPSIHLLAAKSLAAAGQREAALEIVRSILS
jgi:hypothetical protein